mgnify:CR=1 FL=1
MGENMDIFAKAWLFLYVAAGENIGFEVRPATSSSEEQEAKPA